MSILEKLVFKEDWDGEKSEFNLKDLLDTSDSKKLTNDIKIELEVYLGEMKLDYISRDIPNHKTKLRIHMETVDAIEEILKKIKEHEKWKLEKK